MYNARRMAATRKRNLMQGRSSILLLLVCLLVACAVAVRLTFPTRYSLDVSSEPSGAMVFLDQKPAGQTPVTLGDLSEGEHQLRVAHAGYRDRIERINIEDRGATVKVCLDPLPPSGSLVVYSEPPGARVLVDGEEGPLTPARIDDLVAGKHTLRLEKPGHEPHEQTVELGAGQESTVNALLVSKRAVRYEEEIEEHPEDLANYVGLTHALIRNGDLQGAFEALRRTMEAYDIRNRWPDRAFNDLVGAMLEAEPNPKSESWETVVSELLSSAQASGGSRRNHFPLYQLLEQLGKWESIVKMCTDAIGHRGHQPHFYWWRMAAAAQLGNRETMERDLAVVSRSRPGRGVHWTMEQVHESLIRGGRWEEIIRICDAFLRLPNADDKHHLWRFHAAWQLRDWKRAAAQFEAMLSSGVVDRAPEKPRRSWGTKLSPNREALLWAGSLARLRLDDWKGVEELIRRYGDRRGNSHWVSSIRSERWLGDRVGNPPKPWLDATPCKEKPVIDGTIDDEAWAGAGRSSRFHNVKTRRESALPTILLALYDEQTLYLAVDCRATGNPAAKADASPGFVGNTRLEVFIDANRDSSTYVQLMLDGAGTRTAFACVKSPFNWNFDIEAQWTADFPLAAAETEAGWTFEMAFPHDFFGVETPRAGTAWQFNVVRTTDGADSGPVSFVKLSRSYHQPERNALLLFQ